MMRGRKVAALVLMAALVTTGGGSATGAQTPAEAALAAGDVALAATLAKATLKAAPEDPVARAVLAAVSLSQGDSFSARRDARRSWAAATTPELGFVAARLAARAAHDDGAPLASQFWLRRAVHMAPDPASRQSAINDIKALQREQRLSFSLEAAISPSDNVNNGSRDRVLSIDGRPTIFVFGGSAMALSGVEASVAFGLRYRLAGTADAGSVVGLRVRQRAVMLSDAAKRQAPAARAADYAGTSVDLTFAHTVQLDARKALRGGVTLTQNWLGGTPWSQQARVDAALAFPLGQTMQSRISIAADRQWRTANLAFATALTLEGTVERRLASGDVVGLRLMAAQTLSADRNQENTRLGAEARYVREAPIAGGRLSASLGVSAVDYPVFFGGLFSSTGREDLTVSSSVEMAFPKMGAFGFEPVVALQGSKTQSNISRYDTRSLGLEVRIKSSF